MIEGSQMLVQKLRLQRGWSQEQLAELSGLSVRTIQRLERGQVASIESLKALAAAFEIGYDALKNIDELKLFQWAGKLLYGIIFNEIQSGIKLQHSQGEEFNISQSIIHKFSHLHLMLQSINLPLQFDDFRPYSVFLFKVDNNEKEFGYRDEINTMTFALRIHDFGLVICLQDNGANKKYHNEVLDKIQNESPHPIQFEEFCGRVFYSAYLFKKDFINDIPKQKKKVF